jgi:PAS domain S-box-containing protein
MEFRLKTKSGDWRWILGRGKAVSRGADGRALRMVGTHVDITERKWAEEFLKDSQRMLQTVLDHFPGFVYWKNRQSVYLGCNLAFATLAGLSVPMQIIDKTDYDLPWFTAEADVSRADDQNVMDTGVPRIGYIQLQHLNNGKTIWLETNKVPILDEDGKIIGILGVSQDITKRVAAEEEIRALNTSLERRVQERTTQLESANKELQSFSYSIAHDLRAPLRAMDGFSHILLEENDDQLNDQGKEHLRRIRKASHRMGQLIDDLLKLLQVTRYEFNLKEVNLSELGQDAIHEKKTLQPERKVNFICPENLWVKADPGMMRIVITNLIDNAWKFTRRSSRATIEMGSFIREGKTVFYIKDNGIGFDMAYANKLFNPFERLQTSDEFEGTGIGLAMAERIIHRHGGKIWAEAVLEKGTSICFTLD